MDGLSAGLITENQRKVLERFYATSCTKIVFSKAQRTKIWNDFKTSRQLPEPSIEEKSPALWAELEKAVTSGNNIQSAVFSECVYAQTLADSLNLTNFFNYSLTPHCLTDSVLEILRTHNLRPRYVYVSRDGDLILVQAGGLAGVDAALISTKSGDVFTLEFKESAAKTSEPDLPRYSEDGTLAVTSEFLNKNPQFAPMIKEQERLGLNFWDALGTNIHSFSLEAITTAVSENYGASKYADVICVEDVNGFLVMLPANEVGLWSETRGEIRPAGRNHTSVWTPIKLRNVIYDKGGVIDHGRVSIPLSALTPAKARGGKTLSRYKLNSVFFSKASDVSVVGGMAYFSLDKVRQLLPTIAAHMFFSALRVEEVHQHYFQEN